MHECATAYISLISYSVYAAAISVVLSVCLSDAKRRVKTAEHIIEILLLSDRPISLVFHHQWLMCKSDGFTPKAGAEYKRDNNFQCGYFKR